MSVPIDDRIAALESAVADLTRELAEARLPQVRTMRATRRCPSCGGRRLLHFRRITDVSHGRTFALSLQKIWSDWRGVKKSGGTLEAFACRACRVVEWHAASLDDVSPDGTSVIEIVGSDDTDTGRGTPYR